MRRVTMIMELLRQMYIRSTGRLALFVVLLAGGAGSSLDAFALGVCEVEMAKAAHRHSVPLQVLYSVGLTESGKHGFMLPYAMNVEGRTVLATSLQEAMRQFWVLRAKGSGLIDIGCMQVNYRYHQKEFAGVADMFQPARNVDYAARFLKKLHGREGSWTMAVARYNAGPNNIPAQRKYVCSVIRSMIGAGMGGWTPSSRALCGG